MDLGIGEIPDKRTSALRADVMKFPVLIPAFGTGEGGFIGFHGISVWLRAQEYSDSGGKSEQDGVIYSPDSR